MLHDEAVYPDHQRFHPERFLKDGQLDPDVRPPEIIAFGFGPRHAFATYVEIFLT
jgi:cytochrome P450